VIKIEFVLAITALLRSTGLYVTHEIRQGWGRSTCKCLHALGASSRVLDLSPWRLFITSLFEIPLGDLDLYHHATRVWLNVQAPEHGNMVTYSHVSISLHCRSGQDSWSRRARSSVFILCIYRMFCARISKFQND